MKASYTGLAGLSSAQVDANSAAATALDRIAAERNEAVDSVVKHLRKGNSLTAQSVLKQSIEKQARLAGCGRVMLPMAPGHHVASSASESWARNVWQVIARRNGLVR